MNNKYFLSIPLIAFMSITAMQEPDDMPMHSEDMFIPPVKIVVSTSVPTISQIFQESYRSPEPSKQAQSLLTRVEVQYGIPQPRNSVAGLNQLPDDFLVKKTKEEARLLAEKKIAEKIAAGEFNHHNPAIARANQQEEHYKLYAQYRLKTAKKLGARPALPQNENSSIEHEEPRLRQSDLENWAEKVRAAIKSANADEIKSLLSSKNKCIHGSLNVQTMSFTPVTGTGVLTSYLPPALAVLAEIPKENTHFVNLVGALLIQSGAKVDDCNGEGISALSWVCQHPNKPSAREAARFLLDHGAEKNMYYKTDTISISDDNNNNFADFLSRPMLRPYPIQRGTFFDIRKMQCTGANACPCPKCIISSKKGEKARGIARLLNPRPMLVHPSIPKAPNSTPAFKVRKIDGQQSAVDDRIVEQAKLKKQISDRLKSSRM